MADGSLSLFSKTLRCPSSSRKLTTLLPDRCDAHQRLGVDSVQDGDHGSGLCTVLTCSGAQEHVVELYLWSGRFLSVSAVVMILHSKTFDAVVAPTARRDVCHPLCRARAVVREDRYLLCTNLSGWFLGDFSREWAESRCCLCIPCIVHSNPMNAITSQDLALFLSTTKLPSITSALKSPACIFNPREREPSGPLPAATSKLMSYAWFSSCFRTMVVPKCSTSAPARTAQLQTRGSRCSHEAWRTREDSCTRIKEHQTLYVHGGLCLHPEGDVLLDLDLTPSTMKRAVRQLVEDRNPWHPTRRLFLQKLNWPCPLRASGTPTSCGRASRSKCISSSPPRTRQCTESPSPSSSSSSSSCRCLYPCPCPSPCLCPFLCHDEEHQLTNTSLGSFNCRLSVTSEPVAQNGEQHSSESAP